MEKQYNTAKFKKIKKLRPHGKKQDSIIESYENYRNTADIINYVPMADKIAILTKSGASFAPRSEQFDTIPVGNDGIIRGDIRAPFERVFGFDIADASEAQKERLATMDAVTKIAKRAQLYKEWAKDPANAGLDKNTGKPPHVNKPKENPPPGQGGEGSGAAAAPE